MANAELLIDPELNPFLATLTDDEIIEWNQSEEMFDPRLEDEIDLLILELKGR